MEAKVHEATNNEAWGASSTLMQEIAQGTFNYQYFNEIMPALYKRFTEKEAKQWRQIYKALVLLEYLVKNGSERVVDDARSHISTIKIMRNFHFIDEKGKDQGINIRNRAKEISDLLSNTDLIKSERKKARANRNKYTGVGSEAMHGSRGSIGGGSSRYGGFGSDSVYSSGGNGSIGGEGGSGSGYYDEDDRSNNFETSKYDDFDDIPKKSFQREESSPAKPKTAKEANLFDFGDNGKSNNREDEDDWGDFATDVMITDDFDDFQSAPTPTVMATPAPTTAKPSNTNDLFDLLGDDAFSAPVAAPVPAVQQQRQSLQQFSFDSIGSPVVAAQPLAPQNQPRNPSGAEPAQPAKKVELPGGIWSQASSFVSLDSLGKTSGPAKPAAGPSMNTLKTSSANAGWSDWASSNQTTSNTTNKNQSSTSSAFDDLLF
ncbi:hypothetical protein CLU79DRAFT_712102 [Phycomyces nitens]|nr:hypothetical protein CLU79DRAFT_712102 [Phycomyces nitens]